MINIKILQKILNIFLLNYVLVIHIIEGTKLKFFDIDA